MSQNALTLPMGVNLASFHVVAGQLSVNLKLLSRRYFLLFTAHTVSMRASAPGCDRFFNYAVAFFSHPGAITLMGAITPIPVRKHN